MAIKVNISWWLYCFFFFLYKICTPLSWWIYKNQCYISIYAKKSSLWSRAAAASLYIRTHTNTLIQINCMCRHIASFALRKLHLCYSVFHSSDLRLFGISQLVHFSVFSFCVLTGIAVVLCCFLYYMRRRRRQQRRTTFRETIILY